MNRGTALACAFVLLSAGQAHSDQNAAYTSCAACHLADGAGIPGAFPPLKNRVAAIAALEGGREYLIAVVSSGLMGQIEAGGMQYFGVMPGNKGPMSAADIADALNYVVFELVDDENNGGTIEPITADEVAAVQENTTAGGPSAAAKIRQDLVDTHGELWAD